jgi:uncharacterized protein (TIGR00255 family)
MIRSMTAFARIGRSADWGEAQWELRSVNNRYLDVAPRMPEDVRSLDVAVRERVAVRLGRGKVDCVLRLTYATASDASFTLNMDLVRRISDASRQIDGVLHDAARVNSIEVLRWPGVIESDPPEMKAVGATVLEALDEALAELVATREREGEKIRAMLLARCDGIDEVVAQMRTLMPELVEGARSRLRARVAELVEQVDPERLEQEIVLVAQKADVAEELDRLDAHVTEVRRVLDGSKPVGRRLDFLMQELNREANTLGSKSIDTRSTRASVDLKVLIEQMREQVQNVE